MGDLDRIPLPFSFSFNFLSVFVRIYYCQAAPADVVFKSAFSYFQQSSEDLVKNTINILDKVATAISSTMTPSDPPIAISTPSLGMSIAVVDQAGAKMNAGFAKIEVEGAPASALPLKVNHEYILTNGIPCFLVCSPNHNAYLGLLRITHCYETKNTG